MARGPYDQTSRGVAGRKAAAPDTPIPQGQGGLTAAELHKTVVPVRLASGASGFYKELREALGIKDSSGEESTTTAASGTNTETPDGLKAILTSQEAITEATRQITEDLKTASQMVIDFTSQFARDASNHSNAMAQDRKREREHMEELVDLMEQGMTSMQQVAQRITTAVPSSSGGGGGAGGGGVGGGAGGGGGGGGLYMGVRGMSHNPVSYGALRRGVGSMMHAAAGTAEAPAMQAVYNSEGQVSHYVAHGPNGARQRIAADNPAVPGMLASSRRKQLVNNVSSAFQGAGTMGALRATPYIGAALEGANLVNKGATWITDQRAANAQYQSIYGGANFSAGGAMSTLGDLISGQTSTDNSGFSQRMQEEGFVLGQRFSGGMNSSMSRQAFQGVSSLGYNGDQRSNALDFISQAYNQLGMSVSQSLQLVQTSAQYFNQSMSGVTQGLTQVTQAAQQTGQSAAALQQNFSQNYSTALGSGMGAGSGAMAQAMTLSTAGMNRDLSGVNLGSLMSNPVIAQRIAATGGMTLGQMESQVAQGNITAFTKPAQQIMNQTMMGTMDQSVRSAMSSAVAQQGGNAAVAQSPGSQYAVAMSMMGNQNWNVTSARAALGTMGISTTSMTDEQVAEYYVSQLTSGGLGAQGAAAQTKQDAITPTNLRGDLPSQFVGQVKIGALSGKAPAGGNRPGLFDDISTLWGGDAATHNYANTQAIAGAYQNYQTQYRVSNPAIESMIKDLGTNTGTQIRVHTSSGDQVVSIQDAIKYYSDQLSSGQASVVGGTNNGKTLSQVTGISDQGYVPGKTGSQVTTKSAAVAGVGQSWTDYLKANPNANANSSQNTATSNATNGGTVTISPSPELMQLLNFNGTGNVNISGAAASGVPPTVSSGG
jgi:hypothetical protein